MGLKVFTESGTFNAAANVVYKITAVGGGSGGRTSLANAAGGQGGHAGEIMIAVWSPTSGQAVPVTVGTGGLANQAGGITSFGDIVSASGGRAVTAVTTAGAGGAVMRDGSDGQDGYVIGQGGSAGAPGTGSGSGDIKGNGGRGGKGAGAGGGGAGGGLGEGGAGAKGICVIAWED